jgi:hypothetical protein
MTGLKRCTDLYHLTAKGLLLALFASTVTAVLLDGPLGSPCLYTYYLDTDDQDRDEPRGLDAPAPTHQHRVESVVLRQDERGVRR